MIRALAFGASITALAAIVFGKSVTSDSSVAWLLADAASPCLTGDDRTNVFVELGCGDNHLAIERILAVVVHKRFPLPAALLATLTRWLDPYVGSREERRIRALAARVRPLS
ncbi:MAG: tryptophanase [Mycobacterium sp.]|nr:tryptophanase [Mycobacterium sp.]